MDKDLYEMMQKILEIKKTNFTEDIRYLGTITSNESTPTGSVQVTRDIFMLIDQMPDGSAVQKFYDGDGNFVAGSSNLDNKIYPSATFAEEDLSFMGQLEDLSKTSGISLNEFDNYLENIAKTLGVSKEDILSMSTVDLNQKVATKGKIQLGLDEDDEENEQSSINANILNNISKKQEIDLNQKVDDDHTLAEILGVPAGSKLISVYSDRIEILSHGALSPKLTLNDFYKGKSEPKNRKLSDIFLQLHISERTGRGVPTILKNYGESAFSFSDNWIQVTIPFNFINAVDYQISTKVVNKSGEYVVNKLLNKSQLLILKAVRNNPNVTIEGLTKETGLGHTAIQNNLNKLQEMSIIKRIGSRKKGYWEVM